MGRLRLSTVKDWGEPTQKNGSSKSHVEFVEKVVANRQEHAMASRRTADADLPFISAEEVSKRNGKEGKRLCKYLYNSNSLCYGHWQAKAEPRA